MTHSLPRHELLDIESLRGKALQSFYEVFGRLAEGAFVIDENCTIVWANERYLAFIGLGAPDQVMGRHIREVVPTTRMPEVVRTGKSIPIDLIEVNGRWAVVSRFPIKSEQDRVVGGFCFVLFDELDPLRVIAARLSELQAELEETRTRLDRLRQAKYQFRNFVGGSVAALEVMLRARQVAATDSTVLLLGETGTGKELVAQGIHAASRRSKKNFVAINVAAIPDELMEAEFFGAGPGAYTGAHPKGRVGKMVLAHRGTLFLDEIGDMPMHMQVKLLRVLQEREVEPVGSNTVIPLDIRLIAATSRDLTRAVERGEFRADLYYRLSVVPIEIPPLRERLEDLPALVEVLLDDVCCTLNIGSKSIEPKAISLLSSYHWPGNVRELRNALERACVVSSGSSVLRNEHFKLPKPGGAEAVQHGGSLHRAVNDLERQAILDALERANGNKIAAARMLGVSRSTLYNKIRHYDLGST